MDNETPHVSLWRRFCPELAVYLPKYVTVQNYRLGTLHIFLMLVCVSLTVYYFVSNDKYMVTKNPITSISICRQYCRQKLKEQLSGGVCEASNAAFVHSNVIYQNIVCASSCTAGNFGFGGTPCLVDSDLIRIDGETAFIPTFFRDEIYVPKIIGSGNCSAGYQEVSGKPHLCTRVWNYYVAGAEQLTLSFNYAFYLRPHENILDPRKLFIETPQLMAHSGSFNPEGWDHSLYSILFDAQGNEVTRYEQGKMISLSLRDLLNNAYFEEQNKDTSSHLSLNTQFVQPDLGVSELMPLRLTGAVITIDLYVTDLGECPVHDTLRQEIRKIKVTSGRPVACMTLHALPSWEVVEEAMPMGSDGSIRLQQANGIRIRFRKIGKFTFVDERQMMNSLTVFLVWIQIPVVMTYWFCIYALGMLSRIYKHVIHQELDLREACTGLVARLMCHSAAFMDLRDHEHGISKARIFERLGDILECHESIDDDEHWRFAEFVFDGLKMYKNVEDNQRKYVDLQEFCEVCSSSEPLTFQSFVRLFDNDRRLRTCERILLDKSLRDMRMEVLCREPSAASDDGDTSPMSNPELGKKILPDSESRVDLAMRDVQELMDNLGGLERKTYQAATALEVGDEVLALVAPPEARDDSDEQANPSATTDPSLEQQQPQPDLVIVDEAEIPRSRMPFDSVSLLRGRSSLRLSFARSADSSD